MNPCLAILGHAGAAKTCADFLSKWRSLGVPLYAFVPDGHWLMGFDTVHQQGRSAHKGFYVFDRFLRCCETLLTTLHDVFVIAEYDTVNLRAELPTYRAGKVTSPGVWTPPMAGESHRPQMCLLSPWTTDREWLARFVECARQSLQTDPDFPAGGGLLDRWIGEVVMDCKLPAANCDNALGYPWHVGMDERIKRMGYVWIHGMKSKAEFGASWTE